ncbi:hypothetical protein [Flavobacterium orientale]|uniref:Uncharacterized protein n=1 Tax=Flavobacterium orientale TaxID=1756020 RepID=A0A917DD69_9FLAO|nr:hypothetical protein [Flavobacterium orientale]GGD26937.1 hypothetical protein GCM10011343_16470 [Flavobacterium orientale]
MKKSVFLLSLMAGIVSISCGQKEEKPADTIIIEQPAQESAPKVEEEKDGTSLEVTKDGVKFETKDGDKSTSVKVEGN